MFAADKYEWCPALTPLRPPAPGAWLLVEAGDSAKIRERASVYLRLTSKPAGGGLIRCDYDRVAHLHGQCIILYDVGWKDGMPDGVFILVRPVPSAQVVLTASLAVSHQTLQRCSITVTYFALSGDVLGTHEFSGNSDLRMTDIAVQGRFLVLHNLTSFNQEVTVLIEGKQTSPWARLWTPCAHTRPIQSRLKVKTSPGKMRLALLLRALRQGKSVCIDDML